MIKKFNQYIKESNEYKNIVIGNDEFFNMLSEQVIKTTEDDVEKIEHHFRTRYGSDRSIILYNFTKYENLIVIKISSKKIKGGDILHAQAYIEIYKLTDEWFLLRFTQCDGIYKYYKCDEMQGLLNQIDELIEINIYNRKEI